MTARVSFDFTGTAALITGGTSGIGYATAVLFRDAGADVTITGTKAAAEKYNADLSGMAYHQLHIADPDSVDALAQKFSGLDVPVNNAGANFPGGRDESKPDGFEASVALNLTGPYRYGRTLRRVEGLDRGGRRQRGQSGVAVGAASGHPGTRLRRREGRGHLCHTKSRRQMGG